MEEQELQRVREMRIDQMKGCFSMQDFTELKFLFVKAWEEAFELGYSHCESGKKRPKKKS